VLITEYDLPRRTIAPHDRAHRPPGHGVVLDFFRDTLGRLDPSTGAHKEFALPAVKPDAPTGALCLEPDGDGNLWLSGCSRRGW